jgi:hypothetical protein
MRSDLPGVVVRYPVQNRLGAWVLPEVQWERQTATAKLSGDVVEPRARECSLAGARRKGSGASDALDRDSVGMRGKRLEIFRIGSEDGSAWLSHRHDESVNR